MAQDDGRAGADETAVGIGAFETVVTPTFGHMSSRGQRGRGGAGADVLAEGEDEAVDRGTIGGREDGLQGGQGLLGGLGPDVAPAVGDAVDVDVHRDRGVAAGDASRELRALGADAGEAPHDVVVAGQLAGVIAEDGLGHGPDLDGLAVAEGRGVDQALDLGGEECGHGGGVGRDGEETAGDGEADLLQGPDGDHAGDELLEGRREAVGGELEHRRERVACDGVSDAAHGLIDVEGGGLRRKDGGDHVAIDARMWP